MRKYIRMLTSLPAVCIITMLISQGPLSAGKVSDFDYIVRTEYALHQGMVTFISKASDYLIVSERKVELVEVAHKGNVFATRIHDNDGSSISLKNLEIGTWVYVFGGVRKENGIAAKDIYVLPGKLSEKALNDFAGEKLLRTWKSEVYLHR